MPPTGSLDAGSLIDAVDSVQTASARHDWEVLCTPTDPGLAEASGLAFVGDRLYVLPDGDGHSRTRIAELDRDCGVVRWIDTGVVGVNTEDLASVDGMLVVADIGDNASARDEISFIVVDPAETDPSPTGVHRLRYTDGARDAEALVVAPDGRFVIVSKDPFGTGRISRPVGDPRILELGAGVTDLEPHGSVRMYAGEGAGSMGLGAVGSGEAGSSSPFGVVTGGGTAVDGSVVVLRTYWQVYVYRFTGDLTESLKSRPVVFAAPDEPQGEAVAVSSAGDLLTLSEWRDDGPRALWVHHT